MMWKFSASLVLVCLLLDPVQMEYAIAGNSEKEGYYYPAPPKSQQLIEPIFKSQQPAYETPQVFHNQYQGNTYTVKLLQQSAGITRHFSSPALDDVAFNLALTHQGYTFGRKPGFNAALRASPRSSKTHFKSTTSSRPKSSSSPKLGSVNIKLPLPIGVTPINIAPLPLQGGTPYANIPKSVTSYGTVYPQRK